MFSFLHPFAVAALLGLAVPLLIHLWERRQGRRVLVGSIRLLEESEEQRISYLKLTDLWRLILRAAIVVIFVLLLTGPGWRPKGDDASSSRHWVLVDPNLVIEGSLLAVLDSLQGQGFPIQLLASDFPIWAPEVRSGAADTSVSYWSLLTELSRRRPAPDTVTIFGDPLLWRFTGKRPHLPLVVRWQSVPGGGPHSFIVAAWPGEGVVEVVVGRSAAEGTTFHRTGIPAQPGRHLLPEPLPPIVLTSDARPGAWQVQLASNLQPPVPVTSRPQRTAYIYYDEAMVEDQHYLRAAIRAAAAFTGFTIDAKWLPVQEFKAPPVEKDDRSGWLFWLSEQPVPPEATAVFSSRLIQYQPAQLYRDGFFQEEGDRVALLRRLALPEMTSGIGDRLPAELIVLLFWDVVESRPSNDQRHIAENQLQPEYKEGETGKSDDTAPYFSLHFYLWLALLGLFMVERLMTVGVRS